MKQLYIDGKREDLYTAYIPWPISPSSANLFYMHNQLRLAASQSDEYWVRFNISAIFSKYRTISFGNWVVNCINLCSGLSTGR